MQRKRFTKKAFTLIELLIVIAIIGILFIVLVSKVDFATDKAKASGVQTDFRSFQMAFDTVAKENAGFNTFGWDTGDANQDGIRNSYDEGDNGAGGGIAKNGIQDGTEVFTGRKIYDETFTKVFSLKKNGTGSYDRDALNRLETAINANLDPKLHITIKDDGEVVMANGAKDPWNKEYHGWYITNAETDGQDRGAIVMYSDGANNEFGSEHTIANGIVKVIVPGSNKAGKDDYSIVSLYTYTNGYGEVQNITTGFSNNQLMSGGNTEVGNLVTPPAEDNVIYDMLDGQNQVVDGTESVSFRSLADYNTFKEVRLNDEIVDPGNYTVTEGSTIITFKEEFIANLKNGQYTIKIVSEDGCAQTTMYVQGNQESGSESDEMKLLYVNTRYTLRSGEGSYLVVYDDNSVGIYDRNGRENAMIPPVCVTINANNSLTIAGTGEFDNTFIFVDNGRYIVYKNGDETYLAAVKEACCDHTRFNENEACWYYWYDSNNEQVSLYEATFDDLKNCTLRCSNCFGVIQTRFFDDSDYIYIFNGSMEPQYVTDGQRIPYTCADTEYMPVNGWVAIPYITSKTNNLYATIDGVPVTHVQVMNGVTLHEGVKYVNLMAFFGNNSTEAEFTYSGTIARFETLLCTPYATYPNAIDSMVSGSSGKTITIHCNDGDIIIQNFQRIQ